MSSSDDVTYMSCILERLWPTQKLQKVHVAYAIGVCVTLLDPKESNIRISALNLKKKTQRYLVRLYKFV
jgi:hypothetical protein